MRPCAAAGVLAAVLLVPAGHVAGQTVQYDPERIDSPETLERVDSPAQIDSWNRTWSFLDEHLRAFQHVPAGDRAATVRPGAPTQPAGAP